MPSKALTLTTAYRRLAILPPAPIRERSKPKRQPLSDHLPRQEVVHQPADDGACTCPDCGRGMAKLGEDVTQVLDYVPGYFQVICHVRPKYACTACDAITQAPAPAMPTPRGRATSGTLAHLLVSKYCDHLPLYRQSEIFARDGLELDRSTLSDWVGQAAWLLDPVVAAIRRHVFAGEKIHGDDTTVPVLAPGLGRTKTGRLWVYVRDDRPFCGEAPPAAGCGLPGACCCPGPDLTDASVLSAPALAVRLTQPRIRRAENVCRPRRPRDRCAG